MQMIALKNEFTTFSRRADAKIGLLKEVIERVQKGEEVDVKGLLGTGDPEQEKEWEQGQYSRELTPNALIADICHCRSNPRDRTRRPPVASKSASARAKESLGRS